MKTFFITLLAIIVVALISLRVYYGPDIYEFFGKRYATAERNIFTDSKPFVAGSAIDLTKKMYEYRDAATADKKKGIILYVRMQYVELDRSALNTQLRAWLTEIDNVNVGMLKDAPLETK